MLDINYIDELRIKRMPHKTYISVVEYIGSLSPTCKGLSTAGNATLFKPLRINCIDRVFAGNPPFYEGVCIGIASQGDSVEKEYCSQAVQGLAKIIFEVSTVPEFRIPE